MSVPTKTGLEIMKSCLVREREDGLQYIPDDIHLKYILLEDHQEREKMLIDMINGMLEGLECSCQKTQSPNQCKPSREAVKDKPSQTSSYSGESEPVGVSSLPKITRVELINQKGRQYVTWKAKNVQFSVQDNERTLKVFLEDEK